MSLMACPLFYLIKVSILNNGITFLTSAVYGNSEKLKNQAGMLYGKLTKYLNAMNLCWERETTRFQLCCNIFGSSC